MTRLSLRPSAGVIVAAAWLAAVAVLTVLPELGVVALPGALACSPDAVADGQLWRLLSSGLVIQGPLPAAQWVGTAFLAWVVVVRLGAALFWLAALLAHVGGALLAYAGIGLLWLVDAPAVRGVAAAHDYGISAVWAGCAGAVAVAGALGRLPRPRLAAALGVACLLAMLVLLGANGELVDVEHLLAFLAGALVAALALRDRSGSGDALSPSPRRWRGTAAPRAR